MMADAIKNRHSVRAYTSQSIEEDKVAALNRLIDEINRESGLHIQLVTDDVQAFDSRLARYGRFSGVSNYVCMVGEASSQVHPLIGYYGERIVLDAQALGLNTCWVVLTYSKRKTRCMVDDGERLHAVIAIGYGATQGHGHKMRTPQQICKHISEMPEWFRRGVDYALLAPTAINQQKFHFALNADGKVQASTDWGYYAKIDLGIAMLHFQIGAGTEFPGWAD